MTQDFARVFYDDELGQVLILLDLTEPHVRVYFHPENAGLCYLTFDFEDDTMGLADDKALACFETIIEEELVELIMSFIGGID